MAKGGAREGAGRKPLPEHQKTKSVPIAFKIKPDAAEALDCLAIRWGISKSKALQKAILQTMEKENSMNGPQPPSSH